MSELPTGTVTLLFTDVEGSTRMLQELGARWKKAVEDHQELLRAAFHEWGGHEVGTQGDSFFVAFRSAADALSAAAAGQRALAAHPWPEGFPVRVRMGLHTGEPKLGGGDYLGLDVHRAARISAAGHGGQILLSQTTYELVRDALPEGASLRALGEYRLKDLQRPEPLFQFVAPDLPADFPPLKSLSAYSHNLPLQPTRLIGREQELAAAGALLQREEVRLLTLTGPGGTGKTRLGLQLAADLLDVFADGVYFVDLAPISDPELVASTIATVLGLREEGDLPLRERLKECLRDKQLLLLLDNFEQVLGAAPLVAELLASSPRLKLLVTSRAPLQLRGEQEFPVHPLAVPDLSGAQAVETVSQYAAVALFIERALAVKPDFRVTNETAPAVAEICHCLDGLPLAIELAAARIRLFSPEALLARLENRLKLLTSGARDMPARQQTLRNAIAWSYDLLGEAEQILFRRLSVFAGGCPLEAVEPVCNADGGLESDLLDGLASLISKSLLRQEEGVNGEPRFRMLETIREFGREELAKDGDAATIQRNHARFFLELAEAAEARLRGPEQVQWMDRLAVEHDNFRAALARSVEIGDVETALRLAGSLYRFWFVRGHMAEGRERLAEVLAAGAPQSTTARAKAQEGLVKLLLYNGELNAARPLAEQCLAIWRELGDKRGIARALNDLGNLVRNQGDRVLAKALYEEGMEIYGELGDRQGIASILNGLGNLAWESGNEEAAHSLYEDALGMQPSDGDPSGRTVLLCNLAELSVRQGDNAAARARSAEALRIAQSVGVGGAP